MDNPPPAQEIAPITVEIKGGKIVRRAPTSPPHEDSMVRLHGLLATETLLLSKTLSSQHGQLCHVLDHVADALGHSYDHTDQLMLGFYAQPLFARAQTADEELLPDTSARLKGLAANLNLFIMRLPEWREHVAQATASPIDPEEAKEGVEAAKRLIDRLYEWKTLFSKKLAVFANNLYLGMAEGMFHGSHTPYGFYRSLMNIIVVTAQAAIDVIPGKFTDDETDELRKALRKNAHEFIYENAETLLRLTVKVTIWQPLKAAILYIRNLGG